MPANVIIQRSSMLSGLGATAPRTEITEAQWTQQVNSQWAAANPLLSKLPFGANVLGIALLGAGAISFALGKKGLGIGLGLAGAAVTVGSVVVTGAWNAPSPYTVGAQPGIAGIGMV